MGSCVLQILELFDKAATSLSEFRRVEAQLFASDGSSLNIPGPSLEEEVIDQARESVMQVVRKNEAQPSDLCRKYDDLAWILNGAAEAEVVELLSRRRCVSKSVLWCTCLRTPPTSAPLGRGFCRPLPDYAAQIDKLRAAVAHVKEELGFPGSKAACPLMLVRSNSPGWRACFPSASPV